MTPEPRDVQANGIRLRVWRWPSDGKPVLVVHGITNSARGWDFVCRELLPELASYAIDLRGHGESDKPERAYGAADYAADLAGAIEALGLAPAMVLGHSLGARASARLAATRPELVERVALVDPPVGRRTPAETEQSMQGFLRQVQASRERGEAAVREQYPHWTDEQVRVRIEGHRQMSDRVMLEPVEKHDPRSTLDDLAAIRCPTLFLYADPSYQGPRPGIVSHEAADQARAALRNGEVKMIERSGHMVPWDNLDDFLEAVRGFLRT